MTPRFKGDDYWGITASAQALHAMVDAFAAEMKKKLTRKLVEGYVGWDEPEKEEFSSDKLRLALREHCNRGDPVDVANFAAMLWNRWETTALKERTNA